MKHTSLWIILGIIAVIVVWAVSANNKMITKQENVSRTTSAAKTSSSKPSTW